MRLFGLRLLASSIANTPDNQGRFGEMKVASIFHPSFFGQEGQIIINDIRLTDGVNKYKIDHVVLLPYGIFVLETKNISGTIKGREEDEQWKNHNGNFINPIKQNNIHVQVLENYLHVTGLHSVIVMANSNKPNNLPANIVNLEELKPYIKSFNKWQKYSEEEIKRIKKQLMLN